MFKKLLLASLASATLLSSAATFAANDTPIHNASYDIARELFAEINPEFVKAWKEQSGKDLKVVQSFAGSSRQAQDIIQGKKVDVVTFNQVSDVDILAKRGLLKEDWATQFPNNSSPYYSTTAFLVREGNPKNIQGWDDLIRDDVKLVFPNPKTSGNARYSYLGAWLFANEKFNGDQEKVKAFVGKLLQNVENFPTGGRGATVAFAQNGQGDVLLTFESEVINIANGDEFKDANLEIVVPEVSVLAEFPVAIVDKVADERGTREQSKAFLDFLYTPQAQELLTRYNYRVHDPKVVEATKDQFAQVRLINPTDVLGTWDEITAKQFDNGGILDQLLAAGR